MLATKIQTFSERKNLFSKKKAVIATLKGEKTRIFAHLIVPLASPKVLLVAFA